MEVKVTHAHHINLTYSGQGKYTATWEGWPTEGPKRIRRTIHVNSSYEFEEAGRIAAYYLADWLQEAPLGMNRKCLVTSITMGQSKPDVRAVLVTTDWT